MLDNDIGMMSTDRMLFCLYGGEISKSYVDDNDIDVGSENDNHLYWWRQLKVPLQET